MNNLFIPYELAVIAYKKGFEIKGYGIGWYYKRRDTGEIHGLDTFYIDTNQNIEQWDKIDEPIEAILYQQILDWLRDKHKLLIVTTHATPKNKYVSIIYKEWNIEVYATLHYLDNYYESFNKVIEEALKLI